MSRNFRLMEINSGRMRFGIARMLKCKSFKEHITATTPCMDRVGNVESHSFGAYNEICDMLRNR